MKEIEFIKNYIGLRNIISQLMQILLSVMVALQTDVQMKRN